MKKYLFAGMSVLMLSALVACSQEEDKEPVVEKEVQEEVVVDEKTEENSTENDALAQYDFDNLPQFAEPKEDDQLVVMKTNKGDVEIKLFKDHAPKAVENFLKLSEDGYYNGIAFHRVINDFMIQGGDPTGTGAGGESIYGTAFEDEFTPVLFNVKGALSMANAGPNTNGSQFFIVQNSELEAGYAEQLEAAGYPTQIVDKYKEFGGTPHLDGVHTVFGQVVSGMDIVDAIATVEVDANAKPLEDVIINSIEVVK